MPELNDTGSSEYTKSIQCTTNNNIYTTVLQCDSSKLKKQLQGGSNITGTDLCVNKPHCAAAVRLVYIQISPGHI